MSGSNELIQISICSKRVDSSTLFLYNINTLTQHRSFIMTQRRGSPVRQAARRATKRAQRSR